ncbi:hypothetical protein F5Y06DRAFT_294490 [Hypoxylon sp. FL0890]|nr:hypothetical protein F5Y06DRAFT_294490 [Hypoxylon sp. FL0890]
MEPIAIVGLSFTLPQGITDEASLWKTLESRLNLMTEWPEDRLTVDSFYDGDYNSPNTLSGRGGHFVKEDLRAFDAPFFSISTKEATGMEPEQRWILETSYHAFENAGMTLESLKGSRTAVFEASMSDGYNKMLAKDPDTMPLTACTGTSFAVRANRVSWYFDLRGPSVHVDTACSGSLVALDLACQAIRNGDASAALVIGCNLMTGPEMSLQLSNQGFLSPNSVCRSFDHRGDGYARGEGFVAIVLKPLADAIQNGDVIRAIVRSTGSNQDGHTPGLSQPSAEAQEDLIRQTYLKAGLDFESTRYFEAHGTGTRLGDPTEMNAIGRVFGTYRSSPGPLYVGSIKANIGHLEGASGLAGIAKAVMTLEKGVIPPNALFEKMNPDIDEELLRVKVPTQSIIWPSSGPRRISVNSFGFGGTNSHAVLDDAYHYLQSRGLAGRHQCAISPISVNGLSLESEQLEGNRLDISKSNGVLSPCTPKLLVMTATNESSLTHVVQKYQEYWQANIWGLQSRVDQLADHLATRHTHFQLRTFAIGGSESTLLTRKPVRASTSTPGIGFIFTGQGAQYAGMGAELLQYPIFRESVHYMDKVLNNTGCSWSILNAIHDRENINTPEYSQPLCTVLQIALVDLLQSFGIIPVAVIGHSSGEIAAAYASGSLSKETACKVAFYRGKLAVKLLKMTAPSSSTSKGAMISVNIPQHKLSAYLEKMESTGKGQVLQDSIHLSCVNSPLNCTLSGTEEAITLLKVQLDKDGIFAHKLDTGGLAYHSPSMQPIVPEYLDALRLVMKESGESMGPSKGETKAKHFVPMISTVTGNPVSPKTLSTPQYWVNNVLSQVKFSEALSSLVSGGTTTLTDLIEIGPHSALRRPVNDTLESRGAAIGADVPPANKKRQIRYHSVLSRSKPALETTLELVGELFSQGCPVSVLRANGYLQDHSDVNRGSAQCTLTLTTNGVIPTYSPLLNLPKYPFDHSYTYWTESRLSRDFRLRRTVKAVPDARELLGRPASDWNPLEPKWRNVLSLEAQPWLEDHIVSGTIILPGTGMLTMAVEAARQHFMVDPEVGNVSISGFYVEKAVFLNPIIVSEEAQNGTETTLHLHPVRRESEKSFGRCEVTIFACRDNRWTECCQCSIVVRFAPIVATEVDGGQEVLMENERVRETYKAWMGSCTQLLESQEFYSFVGGEADVNYGPSFRILEDICWDNNELSAARISLVSLLSPNSQFHTHRRIVAILDASLQLGYAVLSKGLEVIEHTSIPQEFSKIWLSPKLFEGASTHSSSVFLATKISKGDPKTGTAESTIYGLADDQSVLFVMERVKLAAVSRTDRQQSPKKKQQGEGLLCRIDWKPQLSSLNPEQLQRLLCRTSTTRSNEEAMINFFPKLESLMVRAARRALKSHYQRPPETQDTNHMRSNSAHLEKFASQLERLYGQDDGGFNQEFPLGDDNLEAMLQECEEEMPSWAIFPAVARNLNSILQGDRDPLDLIYSTGLAENLYIYLFDQVCDDRFQNFLGLACHERSTIRILEVGAGTGGMTRRALSCLKQIETETGTRVLTEYLYTDISPAFFEEAREKFREFDERMTFKTFDLSSDSYEEDGFETEAYDMIFLGFVLHVAPNLLSTLRNLRKLLKPDGYLVFLELTDPKSSCGNVGFGMLPGWWLSEEEWRSAGPLITESQWGELLSQTGFSGNDIVLRDHNSDACHFSSVIISRKMADERTLPHSPPNCGDARLDDLPSMPRPGIVLIVDDKSEIQLAVADMVCDQLGTMQRASRIITWNDLVQEQERERDPVAAYNDVLVSLLEIGKPFMAGLSERDFNAIKQLVQKLHSLLWVSSGHTEDSNYAYYGVTTGFLRTIRNEAYGKKIVTLSIESLSSRERIRKMEMAEVVRGVSRHITAMLQSSFAVPEKLFATSEEVEYTVLNGYLCTGRAIGEPTLDEHLRRLTAPKLRVEPWLLGPAVKLYMDIPGALDTFQFVKDETHTGSEKLDPDEVEIEAKAWPLNFRDLFLATGRLNWETPCMECTGVVTRVGPSTMKTAKDEQLKPGDRVSMAWVQSFRTYPRAPAKCVRKIPDDVPFEEAASAFTPAMTAFHGLINLVRLKKGERVLIHSAAGSTGQMAIWLAKMVGAEIFATVGYDAKKQFLEDEFGVSSDHIFYSRDASFAQGIKRMTGGTGVDVVLNSLSGEGLRASWECVAPYGRFVEIGKSDIMANSSLPMANFSDNISFFAVDLFHIAVHNTELWLALQDSVGDLLARKVLHHPRPLHCYSVSRVEEAFRFMQSGKNTGRIVITAEQRDMIPKLVCDEDSWRFDANATYLIAGGLGGLGRAIVKWMADKGARYFILPSRSGLSSSSKAAYEAVSELQERGVIVVAPKCDVSSASSLSAVVEECAPTMPEIKGCINASMVLQDAVFENMSYTQWTSSLRSKVDTSWTLHSLFPVGSLDFFILLSSLAGVYGVMSQSNYAAGCTFQDALARQRASKGDNAVSLDIGWMKSIGVVSESEEYKRVMKNTLKVTPVESEILFGAINACCDPSRPLSRHQSDNDNFSGAPEFRHQIFVGATTAADFRGYGNEVPSILQRPLYERIKNSVISSQEQLQNTFEEREKSSHVLFKQASNAKERVDIVVRAVAEKLARALSVPVDSVEPGKLLIDYGVDSLMSVELRNWFIRDFHANIAVFDIMSGITISALGAMVTERTEI